MNSGQPVNDHDKNRNLNFPGWPGFGSPRSNQNLIFFLVCLIIATVLWFLNALSKNYTTTIAHPVEYVEIPRNKFIINQPPNKLNLKVNAHGFTLLRYKISMSLSPLVLNISNLIADTPETSAGVYVVPSANVREDISSQLSSDIELLEINPAVFTLAFDSLGVREVPVGSEIQFDFMPRFDLVTELEFSPPKVTITGPRNTIKDIDTIFTVPRVFKNLEKSLSQEITLTIPRQVIVEPRKVTMIATIDEFTEKTMTLPVWLDNQPENIKVRLFPHEVDVSFRTSLTNYSLITPEDFVLYVSWDDVEHNLPGLRVKIKEMPSVIKSVKISPENVEYLIEKD